MSRSNVSINNIASRCIIYLFRWMLINCSEFFLNWLICWLRTFFCLCNATAYEIRVKSNFFEWSSSMTITIVIFILYEMLTLWWLVRFHFNTSSILRVCDVITLLFLWLICKWCDLTSSFDVMLMYKMKYIDW